MSKQDPLTRLKAGRLARIDALLERALDLPEEDRAALLDRECAEDGELRTEVERLLEASETPAAFLDASDSIERWSGAIVTSMLEGVDGLDSGTVLGHYRVVEEIGRGGMGIVYRAERADGLFEKSVALKLLKRGLDTEEIVRRFVQERQILAILEHPAIARLLDAGETRDGRPFLVMESVQGDPLDEHCDRVRMGIQDRLRLFIEIVEAVSYAHRNLVVHRDLKPGNILVTSDGRPKLLDFGIAKLLDPSVLGTKTVAHRFLTPRYASPEQIEGGLITTATDVYQLGLILCELLCGTIPTSEPRSPARMIDLIDRPDVRTDPDHVAAHRDTTPRALRRRLRGDLETIVAVATHPDPVRRYGTAQGLADDVRRHLAGRTIEGRVDSLVYRLRKAVARHPLGAAATLLFVALTIAYGVNANIHARRLAEERDRARAEAAKVTQVKEILTDLFKTENPHHRLSGESAPDILERGRQRVDKLQGQPEVQAELWATLGEAFSNRGDLAEAQDFLERALSAREELFGANDLRTLHSANLLGSVLDRQGRFDEAAELFERVLEGRRAQLSPEHNAVGQVLHNLGTIESHRRNWQAADEYFREALRINEASLGPTHTEVGLTVLAVGRNRMKLDDYAEAERHIRRALGIFRANGENDRLRLGTALHELASLLHRQGRRLEARELYLEALEKKTAMLGADHYELSTTMNNLGVLLADLGELEGASEYLGESLRLKRSNLGPDHYLVSSSLVNLARVARQLGRYSEAEEMLRDGRRIRVERFGEDHSSLISIDGGMGELALARKRYDEAERHLRAGLRRAERQGRERGDDAEQLWTDLGKLAFDRGRADDAERIFRSTLEKVLDRVAPETLEVAAVRLELGRALHRLDRTHEARQELALALRVLDDHAPVRAARTRALLANEGIEVDLPR